MAKTGCKPVSTETRFWRHVLKSDDCWEWTASLNHSGYGVFSATTQHRGAKIEGAHRFSWRLHNGEIPEGQKVCHHCDNPKCIRPDHLFLGSQRENMDDMVKKGRFKSKLTLEDVKTIKRWSHLSCVELADIFGVTYQSISYIRAGLTWKHVDREAVNV